MHSINRKDGCSMLRSFQYGGQWNIIYYPKKPSGFSVFIIGDHHHFVENQDSYWLHHPGRLQLLEQLQRSGYTAFSSNLSREDWDYKKSALFAKSLYYMIMKSEILNENIHIFAEGKGALTALKLLQELQEQVRSVVFLNPCFTINRRENQKVIHDQAYNKMSLRGRETTVRKINPIQTENKLAADLKLSIPIKIIHVIGDEDTKARSLYRKIQKINKGETEIIHLSPEKRYKVPSETLRFYKKYENVL